MLEEEITCPHCQSKIIISGAKRERVMGERSCEMVCEKCQKKFMVISIDGAFSVIRRE